MPEHALAPIDEKVIKQMEDVAEECGLKAVDGAGRFTQAFRLQAGIQKLREMLTPNIMARIMPLQNTALGFLTDHNPATAKPGQVIEPYGLEVVRDCLVEATLRGFFPVNNEFNIISARCYGTLNGYRRLVKQYPGFSDLTLAPGIPVLNADKTGALVPYSAYWRLGGKADKIVRSLNKETGEDTRIPVRVNFGMGLDAIVGKATRKILAAVYGKMTGSDNTMPEGEVDDPPTIETTGRTVAVGQVDLKDIKPGDPATHQGHEAPVPRPAAPVQHPEHTSDPEPAAEPSAAQEEELADLAINKDDLRKILAGLNGPQSDAILEANGITNLEQCSDLPRLKHALVAAKWAAEVAGKPAAKPSRRK